jgi:glycerophosphoryl diester phosphodiesterase
MAAWHQNNQAAFQLFQDLKNAGHATMTLGVSDKGPTPEASTQEATSLVADAHKLGLFVHVFTFRNEKKYLAADYRGDPSVEYLKFFRLGVDGVFTDFTHTGVSARTAYIRELGW